jgi:hypothetical protein
MTRLARLAALGVLRRTTTALMSHELSTPERLRIARLQAEALATLEAQPRDFRSEIERALATDTGPKRGRPGRIRRKLAQPRPALRTVQLYLQEKTRKDGRHCALDGVSSRHDDTDTESPGEHGRTEGSH